MEKRKIKKKRTKTELPLNQIICDHNVRAMRRFADNSIDSILTDPPYGLEFMGKDWDKVLPPSKTWRECLRVAKPGAFMFVFGGTRTFHRLTCAIEDAGWEIRDCLMWLYGSGFPKSHNIGKAIDEAVGAERKKQWTPYTPKCKRGVIGPGETRPWLVKAQLDGGRWEQTDIPVTDLAQLWDGYGTALKPAWEPIIVAMKPLEKGLTYAENAKKWGVAGLNIDGSRIGTGGDYTIHNAGCSSSNTLAWNEGEKKESGKEYKTTQGRWPANLILDEEAAAMLDAQSGDSKSIGGTKPTPVNRIYGQTIPQPYFNYGDSGGASRFFYCAKASRAERNAGLSGMEAKIGVRINAPRANEIVKTKPRQNNHPTVKPLKLMQYLCTLLKMPGKDQVILDPFVGSGTTCIACKELGINYIGIDDNKDYCEIAIKRLKAVKATLFESLSKKKSKKKKVRESFGLCE